MAILFIFFLLLKLLYFVIQMTLDCENSEIAFTEYFFHICCFIVCMHVKKNDRKEKKQKQHLLNYMENSQKCNRNAFMV